MLDHTRLVQENATTKIGFAGFLILGVVLIASSTLVRDGFVLLALGVTLVTLGAGFAAFLGNAYAGIDTAARAVETRGRFVFATKTVTPFDAIMGATVASFQDPEQHDRHGPMLRLKDGRTVLVPVRSPFEWEVRKWVETLNSALNRGGNFDEVEAAIDDDSWIDEAIARRHAEIAREAVGGSGIAAKPFGRRGNPPPV